MNETNWSEQTDSLGKVVGNWILRELRLPQPILHLLEQEHFGNSLMAYGFLIAALIAGWFAGLMISLMAGRLIRLALDRFSVPFAKGMARAVTGPLHLLLLCWAGVLGTTFLVPPPPSAVTSAAVQAVPAKSPVAPAKPASAAVPRVPGAVVSSGTGTARTGAETQASASLAPAAALLQWQPHYARVVLRGFFSFIMVIALFWIGGRVAGFVWRSHVEPWVESSVRAPEKYYFPIVYRVLMFGWWFWALLSGIASLGFDSRQSIGSVLAYSAAKNTIAEYLSFLGLVVLTVLSARSVFTMVTRQVTRVMAQHGGAKPVNLEETWFAGLERPVVYLIGLLGMRLAAEILHPDAGFNVHGIVTTAIHLCITVVLVWFAFVLLDKLFEFILFPIARVSEVVEIQLVYLGRKTAKVGCAIIGFIFMLKSVGQDPGTLLAGLGIGGLAVSFAARDAVSPFVAGISLYATRPFRMGDFIHLNDNTEGIVEEIGVSATKVRKRDGTLLTIPNNNLTSSVVQNRTVNKRTSDQIPFALPAETTPEERDRVIQMLQDCAGRVFGVKSPMVTCTAYGKDGITLVLSYWLEDAYRLNTVRTALLLEADARLREMKVRRSTEGAAAILAVSREAIPVVPGQVAGSESARPPI